MKNHFTLPVFFLVILLSLQSNAQVTNLVVNGSSSPFTMTSGGALSWSFNLSTGGTALFEIWVDLNSNSIIDENSDIRMFAFTITDGAPEGNNGPGDMDGTVNGAISDGPFPLGLYPANYIMKVTENNVGQTLTGTVSPLQSPAYTISGTVTATGGLSVQNVIVELGRDTQSGVFLWNAVTDANGNYTIEMDADTTGPWQLQISEEQNPFPSAIITPVRYFVFIQSNNTGYNFSVQAADAKVSGTLKFEDGSPASFVDVSLQDINPQSGPGLFFRNITTDINGFFQFGLSASVLQGQKWLLQANIGQSDTTEDFMVPRYQFPSISKGDSLFQRMVFYQADTTITGTVSFSNPSPALNAQGVPGILIIGLTDSMQSAARNDTITGAYTLRVSSKIPSLTVFGIDIPEGFDPITLFNVTPGSQNVNLHYNVTDVKLRDSGIPSSFSLNQNYPNPFNPSTNINYDIPVRTKVVLSVYNQLGQKVADLVNGEQEAGKYTVNFNAKNLASGVYIYKITTESFTQSKKMILIK